MLRLTRAGRLSGYALLLAAVSGCSVLAGMIMGPATVTPADYRAVQAAVQCDDILPLVEFGTLVRSLESSDCALSRAPLSRSRAVNGFRADYYILKISSDLDRGVVRVRLDSDEFDAHTIMADKNGNALGFDADSGPGLNADLNIRLREGLYIIVVTSARSEEFGPYSLRVDWTPPRENTWP